MQSCLRAVKIFPLRICWHMIPPVQDEQKNITILLQDSVLRPGHGMRQCQDVLHPFEYFTLALSLVKS